jgi:hypothetical protein
MMCLSNLLLLRTHYRVYITLPPPPHFSTKRHFPTSQPPAVHLTVHIQFAVYTNIKQTGTLEYLHYANLLRK